MKTTTTFFFLLMAMFALSTLSAQTCEQGLEQIPPMSDSDYNPAGSPNWFTFGNQLAANQITLLESGDMTQVNYVKGAIVSGSVRAAVYNSEMQLIAESNIVSPDFTGTNAIDTVTIPLQVPVFVNAGEIYYVGVKFASNNSRNLRKFDNAEGTRINVNNLWNTPFPQDLNNSPSLDIEDGLYAIWGIVENCVTAVPGCTDPNACNFDEGASTDDGSCEFTSCLCSGDLNGDANRNVSDVLLMLADFGCSTDCIGDLDGDGATSAGDFLLLLGFFGTSCN
jgi:hypothetical protein